MHTLVKSRVIILDPFSGCLELHNIAILYILIVVAIVSGVMAYDRCHIIMRNPD